MKEKPTITEIKIEPLVSYQRNDDNLFDWKPHPVLITGFGNIPFPSPCFEYRRRNSEPQECGTSVSIDMKFLKNKSEYSYEEIIKGAIVALQENLKEITLKKELRFTDKELDLIRNAFQDQIREDKDGWSAEKKIIAKCDELLKERKD